MSRGVPWRTWLGRPHRYLLRRTLNGTCLLGRWCPACLMRRGDPPSRRHSTGRGVCYVVALVAFVTLNGALLSGVPDDWPWGCQLSLVVGLLVSGGMLGWFLRKALMSRYGRFAFALVLAADIVYVVALTMLGYAPCLEGRVPFITQFYYALLLLTGGTPPALGTAHCPDTSLVVQMAQFAAMAVLFAAALRLIAEITANRFARWRVSLARSVILVVGLNNDSLPVIHSLAADPSGSLVVLVEPNPDHPLLAQVKRAGVWVIEGDLSHRSSDLRWLRKVLVGFARWRGGSDAGSFPASRPRPFARTVTLDRAYLLSDDDHANVSAAELIRHQIATLDSDCVRHHLAPPRIIVRIDRYEQGRRYAADQVVAWGADHEPRVFVSSVGRVQVTAHALVERIVERGMPQRWWVVGQGDLVGAIRAEWGFQIAATNLLRNALLTRVDERGTPFPESWPPDDPRRARWDFLTRKSQVPQPEVVPAPPSPEEIATFARAAGRATIVLTVTPDPAELSRLEHCADALDPDRIRIFVPSDEVTGIADYPMLGALQFYGLSLGGLDAADARRQDTRDAGPHPDADWWAPNALYGVPQDAWYRAARLINDAYVGDAWDELHAPDRASNFRALWHTLTYFAASGYRWVSRRPMHYSPPSDEVVTGFHEREHENWRLFKREHGWVGAATRNNDYLENPMLFPWADLQARPVDDPARIQAAAQTSASIRANLHALEALGFFAVMPDHTHTWPRTEGMPVELHNYTPHALLTWLPPDGEPVPLPQLGTARCDEVHLQLGFFDEDQRLPRTVIRYANVTGLPEPEPGVIYVVSQLTVAARPDRDDLAFPAGLRRDAEGTIVGFTLLGRPVSDLTRKALPSGAFDPNGPVFICYRNADGRARADDLDLMLQAAGVPVWRDVRDLPTGNVERRLDEALTGGIAGAVVVATRDIEASRIVRECELPRILQMQAAHPDFSVAIANAIADTAGMMDPDGPDRMLTAGSGLLCGIKQYDMLDPMGPGAISLVTTLLREHLDRRLRSHPLADRRFVIDVQTRLPASASSRPDADLVMRLAWDETHRYPDPRACEALRRVLVPLSDQVYDRSVRTLRLTGSMHLSVALALGCTFTRPRAFPAVLECAQGEVVWSSEGYGDRTDRRVVCDTSVVYTGAEQPTGRVAVLLTVSQQPDLASFDSVLARGPFDRAVRLHLADEDELAPTGAGTDPAFDLSPTDGPVLARQAADVIRDLARGRELHLALQGPHAFAALLGRLLNTLTIVVYERDGATYVPALRLHPGTKPVAEVLLPKGA